MVKTKGNGRSKKTKKRAAINTSVTGKKAVDELQYGLTTFTIEKVVKHKINKNTVCYEVKWAGWSSKDNTFEPESSILNTSSIAKYWGQADKTSREDADIHDGALASIALEGDYVRFISNDHLTIKQMLARNLIPRFGWQYMKEQFIPDPRCLKQDMIPIKRYNAQLHRISFLLAGTAVEYPILQVSCFPGNDEAPSAVPLPIWKMTFDSSPRGASWAPRETYKPNEPCLSIDDLQYLDDDLTQKLVDPTYDDFTVERRAQTNYRSDGVTPVVHLRLARDRNNVWYLASLHELEERKKIIPIFGELVPAAEAEKCLREDGELVAFNSFISLPNNMCLDRRYRSDVTQYIGHSCDPNCRVGLVKTDTGVQLYVSSLRRIKALAPLTIDKFAMFKDDEKWSMIDHGDLRERGIDHIVCQCDGGALCRTVLWKESQKSEKDFHLGKKDKITSMQLDAPFAGLLLHKAAAKNQAPS